MQIDRSRVLDSNFESRFLALQLIIFNSKSSMMIYVTYSTTRTQSFNEACDSNFGRTCYGSGIIGGIGARLDETEAVQARGSSM